MASFYDQSYFCDYCKKAYGSHKDHNCPVICKACKRKNCLYENVKQCPECKRNSRNDICAEIHTLKECVNLKKCSDCGLVKSFKNHVCGEVNKWRLNCKKSVEMNHKCFILTESERTNETSIKNKKKFEGFVFFDFECYQNDDVLDETYGQHVVNLAMACKICTNCLELEPNNRCVSCRKKHTFYNIEDYCKWAFSQKNTIQLAHNLKGKLKFNKV